MVTKHVEYSDDDEIIGWYNSSNGLVFPLTRGGLRRLPKIILKISLLWIKMFLLFVAIVTITLLLTDGWNGMIDFYTHLWNAIVCFWEALEYFWGGVKFIIEECKKYKGH